MLNLVSDALWWQGSRLRARERLRGVGISTRRFDDALLRFVAVILPGGDPVARSQQRAVLWCRCGDPSVPLRGGRWGVPWTTSRGDSKPSRRSTARDGFRQRVKTEHTNKFLCFPARHADDLVLMPFSHNKVLPTQ